MWCPQKDDKTLTLVTRMSIFDSPEKGCSRLESHVFKTSISDYRLSGFTNSTTFNQMQKEAASMRNGLEAL